MRRLSTTDRDDRGGATVFIIIAITAAMIGVGFAVDVGQYVVTVQSAQNTADATALAVAADCAAGKPLGDYSAYSQEGQKFSDPACGTTDECPDGVATMKAKADVDGVFLKRLSGAERERAATACWGTLGSATPTIPIVVAKCEFAQYPFSSTDEIIIHLPETPRATGCDSGPGGFGQLDDGGDCNVVVSSDSTADGKSGNDVFKAFQCIRDPLPVELLIPIYNEEACPGGYCQGNNAYPIDGFAVFKLTGFSLTAGGSDSSGGTPPPECDRTLGRNCISGFFIETTTTQGTPGDSTNFGVTKVYLNN